MWNLEMNISYVHISFEPMTGAEMDDVLKVLKGATAKSANEPEEIVYTATYIGPPQETPAAATEQRW